MSWLPVSMPPKPHLVFCPTFGRSGFVSRRGPGIDLLHQRGAGHSAHPPRLLLGGKRLGRNTETLAIERPANSWAFVVGEAVRHGCRAAGDGSLDRRWGRFGRSVRGD